jgi:S1-C subfamily serine protease
MRLRPSALLALVICLGMACALSPGCALSPAAGPESSRAPSTAVATSSSPATIAPTTTIPRSTTTSAAVTTTTLEPAGDPEAIAQELERSVVGVMAVIESTKTKTVESIGTGVVYSSDGSVALIITNNHVVEREDGSASKRIRVRLPSGSVVSATLVGRDPSRDIAVLRVKSRRLIPAVFRTDLSELAVGDWVVAIGNSQVLEHPVTSGRVTAYRMNVEYPGLSGVHAVIESSVDLDQGNSGGPLVDSQARVIGINTGEYEKEQGALSLPADLVVEVVESLLAAGAAGVTTAPGAAG